MPGTTPKDRMNRHGEMSLATPLAITFAVVIGLIAVAVGVSGAEAAALR
jgi:hypothetical protein